MSRQSKKSYPQVTITVISAIITAIGAIMAALINGRTAIELPIRATQTAFALSTKFAATRTVSVSPSITPTIKSTSQSIITITPVPSNLETQVVLLQNQVATLGSLATQQVSNQNRDAELKTLNEQQKALDDRMGKLESVILDNPEKSLELTFMRKEIDDLKIASKSDSERTLKEIERVYSQNNWFIGLMFTLAIGLISLAVGNFMKKPEKSDDSRRSGPQSRNQYE